MLMEQLVEFSEVAFEVQGCRYRLVVDGIRVGNRSIEQVSEARQANDFILIE